jgi:galactokinase/mevalonate kinase-like predicted kinase
MHREEFKKQLHLLETEIEQLSKDINKMQDASSRREALQELDKVKELAKVMWQKLLEDK